MKHLRTPEGRAISVADDVADEIARNGWVIELSVSSRKGERKTGTTPGFNAIKSCLSDSAGKPTVITLAVANTLDAYAIAGQWGLTDIIPVSALFKPLDQGVYIVLCRNRFDHALGDIKVSVTNNGDSYALSILNQHGRHYSEYVDVDVDGLLVSI